MKVAVLGLGSAGRRHARILAELGCDVVGHDPGVDAPPPGVSALVDRDEAAAKAEAVVVATPSGSHVEDATLALEAGRPTLVEKPLATTYRDAAALAELARRVRKCCAVAMNLRFHPGVIALRELVEKGSLGDIHLATAAFGYDLRRWRPETDYRASYSARSEMGGGIVLDAIHEIDYLAWLLGPVEAVSGITAQVSELEVDVEDVAVAVLRFASGALGTLDLNFFETSYRRGCVLVGSRATARWDWVGAEVVISGVDREAERIGVTSDVEDTYRAELVDFIAAVRDGHEPRTSAAEGAAAVRVAEAIKAGRPLAIA